MLSLFATLRRSADAIALLVLALWFFAGTPVRLHRYVAEHRAPVMLRHGQPQRVILLGSPARCLRALI